MKHILIAFILIAIASHHLISQDKKMTLETYNIWNTIENVNISNDGKWLSYELVPGKGDPTLILVNTETGEKTSFERASEAEFDFGSITLAFKITPPQVILDSLKAADIKKEDMPADTLGIYHLEKTTYDKLAPLKSFKMPEEQGGLLAVLMDTQKDSTAVKKQGKKNGYDMIVYNMNRQSLDVYHYVLDYEWSNKNGILGFRSTGTDSVNHSQVLLADVLNGSLDTILLDHEEFHYMAFDEGGNKMALSYSADSTEKSYAPVRLSLWETQKKKLKTLAESNSEWLGEGWRISPYTGPWFSKNSNRLYIPIHKLLPEIDTSLADSDRAKVEVWNWKDELLYTQQKVASKREQERSYMVLYDFEKNNFMQLTSPENTQGLFDEEYTSDYIVTYDQKKYERFVSWVGYAFRDIFLTNLKTGERKMIAEKVEGRPRMSPSENYVYWYNRPDTSWYSYSIADDKLNRLTKNAFYDELNDRPMPPYNSGFLGWIEDDEAMLIYDDYDIWKLDPQSGDKQRLTQGREEKISYNHISIDRDIRHYPSDTSLLVRIFDERDKSSGYAYLDLVDGGISVVEKAAYNYRSSIQKAKDSNTLVFTKESFKHFPDLILSNLQFENQRTVSDANPQQKGYAWGSIELFEWTDYEGVETDGLLVKPPNFDPSKKYPVIINFYERSSSRLHNHRAPYPGRSTINYSYWANKGYVIFNPDVRYKVGYPGQSCYDAVMSGVDALIQEGFVDEEKIGLQGHSWGGYQIADLLTRTNKFACAESGAPVVNMTSAYGGIRWETGRSRMFQYEHTQSRLGATLWDSPELYLENSPLFRMDKVETPVLILHNDNDGHVPWYQGIEYFVALRRLGKPCWMLNYNNEPHWPLKRENRLDFNKRLEQFFDHYLMDKEMPIWMKEGVPAHLSAFEDGFGY